MKLSHFTLVAIFSATLVLPAFAQPGPGGGMGGGYRFNQANTPGWILMTEAERNDFRQKMWNTKTFEECKTIQTEHHKLMEERAKAKNMKLTPPRYNACDRMKARGYFK